MSWLTQKARAFIRHENEMLDIDLINIPCAALPGALDGYRVAVVADLHLNALSPYHSRILDALSHSKPGCILIAGDSTDDHTDDMRALVPFFSQMSAIAPVVAVLGNNDCDTLRTPALRDMYGYCGITLLENETRQLLANGYPLRITGLTDPGAFRHRVHVERKAQAPNGEQIPLERVALSGVLPPQQTEGVTVPSLLLLHQPQLALSYAHLGASLIIAGHAHGGQIRLPLIGGLYAPGQGVLPKYTSGVYPLGASRMLVSRGLGNHSFYIRLGNRPHLPVAVLVAVEKSK